MMWFQAEVASMPSNVARSLSNDKMPVRAVEVE
jgi:hypothetical protein